MNMKKFFNQDLILSMGVFTCFNPKCNSMFSDEHKSDRVTVKEGNVFIAYCSKACYDSVINQK